MAFNKTTQEMLEMLPVWMKLRDEDSIGGNVIDTFGTQLSHIESLIESMLLSGFVQTNGSENEFNILSIDYIYKVVIDPEVLNKNNEISIIGIKNGISYDLVRSTTVYDFYSPGFKYFLEDYTIYVKEYFDRVIINEIPFDIIEPHHVWGPLDEIGLLFGCPRIALERNSSYKNRLLDVFKNPGNSSKIGLKNYIARSLNISKEDVIIQSLDDDEYIESFINQDGTIKDELKEYIEISKKVNDLGINAYWEVLDEKRQGLRYLPIVWDVGLDAWNDSQIQNGIGDTDDLEIIPPKQEMTIQEFTYALYAEGMNYPDKKIYPEHTFKYKVYAKGAQYDNGYKPETYKYTVTASELIPLTFDVVAHKDYEHHYDLTFSDYPVVSYDEVTDEDKHPNSYIVSNVKITDGGYVTNTNKRFVQIASTLKTDNPITTPQISSIVLEYTKNGDPRIIRIEGEDSISINDNIITVGFECNTWDPALYPDPIIRVKCDTNDMMNTIYQGGNLTLSHGTHEKIYNSTGDWDDGLNNPESINVRVTNSGTLKLSI